MAQPPESGPLQLHSSVNLAPVPPRVQPSLDAPAEQKHHHGQQQPQHQHNHDQQRARDSAPGTSQTSDLPTGGNGARPAHPVEIIKGERSPDVDDRASGLGGISGVVGASSDSHASVARPGDPAPAVLNPRSETPHNGDAPAPSLSANMSNAQPPPGPGRQPMAYANPAAYPPAGMPPVSQYVYPPSIPHADPYRPSPTTLPSMRTLDHRQSQPQPQPQHGIPLGPHMAAPVAPAPAPAHMAYYGVPTHSHMYSLPDPNAMRFALAPGLAHDPRIALSGGRHKKEIKRRTKTGCLTCRKRRIKCDEAHPTCNNCKKSKRECLGYDPIFKQQQGPTAIQPAPSTSTQPPATSAAAAVLAPTVPSSGPHPYQASYPPPLPSNMPPDSVPSTAPQSVKTEPGYDYSTAIDPALQGADPTGAASARGPRFQQNNAAATDTTGQTFGESTQLRGGIPSSHSTLSALSQPPLRETMSAHTISPAKKMKADELIALGAALPQPTTAPPSAEVLDEVTKLYYELYLPGLTHFFETRWYDFTTNRATAANPIAMLHSSQSLLPLFASFIQTISKIEGTNPMDMVPSGHLEASVIWSLARLPLSIALPQRNQNPDKAPAGDDPWEARGRLQIFEALIAGETLPSNPLSPPPVSKILPRHKNELEFWLELANYLLQSHASTSPADASARERCLNAMRSRLDGRENRDVLYSIAVLREYTAHWDASWNEQSVPPHLEESDPRSKLAVATRFIRDESTSTGGTTNVVRRFAELAYRAFVKPGVNVNRNRGHD